EDDEVVLQAGRLVAAPADLQVGLDQLVQVQRPQRGAGRRQELIEVDRTARGIGLPPRLLVERGEALQLRPLLPAQARDFFGATHGPLSLETADRSPGAYASLIIGRALLPVRLGESVTGFRPDAPR